MRRFSASTRRNGPHAEEPDLRRASRSAHARGCAFSVRDGSLAAVLAGKKHDAVQTNRSLMLMSADITEMMSHAMRQATTIIIAGPITAVSRLSEVSSLVS